MARQNYEDALRRVLAHEGGYTNHPADPGGPTNFGITIHDYRRYVKPTATAEDVRKMRIEEAMRIYRAKYWDTQRCDELPSGVDYAVFDYGVNSGIGRSKKVLQRVLGVKVDGVLGPATMEAAANANAAELVRAICDERLAFLKRLRTWPTFGKGWGRRVAEVRAHGLALAKGNEALHPPPTMPSSPDHADKAPDPEEAPKPLTKSKTIWGGVTGFFGGIGAAVMGLFEKLDNPLVFTAFCIIVVLLVVGLVLVIKGRLDVNKVVEQLSGED